MKQTPEHPLAGILYMLLTGLFFVGVIAIVKHLGGGLPAAESAFLRFVFGLVFLLPLFGQLRRARPTRTDMALFALRGVAHTLAVILWFFAMSRIAMAEVTAMNYMSPVYVTIGAALFLGERLAARRIMAVVAALVGALVILRPGFRELSSGHIAMLFAAALFGVSYLVTKLLTGRNSPAVIVAIMALSVTIGLTPFAIAVWVPPTLAQLGWIALVAAFATAGHFTMTLAFQMAPITVTQPVTFLQLVWSVLLGALFFGEPVDGWVVLGGTIIMGAVSFITWREAMLKRRAFTPPSAPPHG